MAVSRNTGHQRNSARLRRVSEQLSWYDIVLAAIPLLFALPLLAYAVIGLPFQAAIAIGSLMSLTLVADVLYVHPPTRPAADSTASDN